jgi:hypothetical protein
MVQRSWGPETLRRLFTLNTRSRLLMRGRSGVKQALSGMLGDRLYHFLWCRLSTEDARQAIDREYAGTQAV